MPKICAVIVTHNSAKYIERLITQLMNQSFSFHKIVLVDNASHDWTVHIINRLSVINPIIDLIINIDNLGGAGGFRVGLERALDYNTDYIITFDDDISIDDQDYLQKIVQYAKVNYLDVTGSLVLDAHNPDSTAYNYNVGNIVSHNKHHILASNDEISEIKLFNGVLFTYAVIDHLKGPTPQFFIRGDEVDFRWQIMQAGYRVATCKQANLYHPQSLTEVITYRGGNIIDVTHQGKQYFSIRNQYYMYVNRVRHNHSFTKMVRITFKDFVRYTSYYLFHTKNKSGYWIWFRAFIDGLTSNMNSGFSKKIKTQFFD